MQKVIEAAWDDRSLLDKEETREAIRKVIDELENSDYSLSVLRENFQIVEEYGAQLEVLLYLEDGSVIVCHNANEVPGSIPAVTMAEVALEYPVRIPFVGLDRSHQLIGYAR